MRMRRHAAPATGATSTRNTDSSYGVYVALVRATTILALHELRVRLRQAVPSKLRLTLDTTHQQDVSTFVQFSAVSWPLSATQNQNKKRVPLTMLKPTLEHTISPPSSPTSQWSTLLRICTFHKSIIAHLLKLYLVLTHPIRVHQVRRM